MSSKKNILKKLFVCSASLVMMASLGEGINNVSAHRIHNSRKTFVLRKYKKNKRFKHSKRSRRISNKHSHHHAYTVSRVNNYILRNHLHHARIRHAIIKHLPKLAYKHGVGHPDGVVVHETGNPRSNIYGEINFMKHDWRNAFVHSFVDNHHIINIANTNYQAWGVAYPGNKHFVQFEQVEMHNKRAFANEVNNAAYYTAHLLKRYHLKPSDAEYTGKGTVWSHAAVAKYMGGSDHVDPVTYYQHCGKRFFGQPYTMRQFYHLVLHYYK